MIRVAEVVTIRTLIVQMFIHQLLMTNAHFVVRKSNM